MWHAAVDADVLAVNRDAASILKQTADANRHALVQLDVFATVGVERRGNGGRLERMEINSPLTAAL